MRARPSIHPGPTHHHPARLRQIVETERKKSELPTPSVVPALPTEQQAAEARPATEAVPEENDDRPSSLLQRRPACTLGANSFILELRQEAVKLLQELAVQFIEADVDHSGALDAEELAQEHSSY